MSRRAGPRLRPCALAAASATVAAMLLASCFFPGMAAPPGPAAAAESARAGLAPVAAPDLDITAPRPAASPAADGADSAAELTLLAFGDILLARTPGKRAAELGHHFLFQDIRDLISGADLAFANLETPASYQGTPYPGKPPVVTFRADPATLFGLAWAGFDVVSLANNHMADYGPAAVLETLEFIDLLGIARCGAGPDLETAREPAVVEAGGATIAFLAYAEPIWSVVGAWSSESAIRATRVETRLERSVPDGFQIGSASLDGASFAGVALAIPEAVLADIRRVKASMRPDYLFVSIHWGLEHEHFPNRYQRELGRAAIDAGATAVLGHHPHVWQSLERRGSGLIAYSMGNLVFDMKADSTYETAALRLILAGGSIRRAEIVPLTIRRGAYAPGPATPEEAAKRLADIKRWSPECGADISVEAGVGVLRFGASR